MLWNILLVAIVTGYVATALFYIIEDFINDAVEDIFK